MCLLLLAHRAHAEYPLVIAANRDEYYARPTQPAAFWADAPEVLAGRDLQAGGTWLGITRQGRWAALTNVRDPGNMRVGAPSRGHLVSAYLLGSAPPRAYLAGIAERVGLYNGFNLLCGDGESVWYLSNYLANHEANDPANHAAGMREVLPGIHGVSNHVLDTPWPKVVLGCSLLSQSLAARPADELDVQALFDVLKSEQAVADAELPDTGVGIERERELAPIFIRSTGYGTCSSTVITVHRSGHVTFVERTTNPALASRPDIEHRFALRG